MNRTVSRALGCALMSALAATLVITAPVGATAPAGAGPGYHQPRVGSCHVLTMRDHRALSAPTAAVPCRRRHTSQTLHVRRSAATVDWESDRLFADMFVPCARKANRLLGGDRLRAMSAYDLSMYIPSKVERAHGARWKRCDLVLVGGRTLQAMPEKLRLGAARPADRYARCLAGPDKRLVVTVCAKAHTYRVTGAVRLGGKKYPGEQRLRAAALDRCPDLVTSRTWRYQTFADPSYWRAGWRSVVCYSKTKA